MPSDKLHVKFCGVDCASPIGVGAVGEHWGKVETDPKKFAEINGGILVKHAKAGAGFILLNGLFLDDEARQAIAQRCRITEIYPPKRSSHEQHRMLAIKGPAPYGVEGFYYVPSPFWPGVNMSDDYGRARAYETVKYIKANRPDNTPLVANVLGIGNITESYVSSAKGWEELGADLLEINVSCPLPTGQRDPVERYETQRYLPYFQGMLVGDVLENVIEITRKVKEAVHIPFGIKLSPETGFPRIVQFAKACRDNGADFVTMFNAAVGIAPPDIYNGGRPSWPYMEGSPFCMASGSFLRVFSMRDTAAVARYVPGITISASGGQVTPEHLVEAMMLGATTLQPCTAIIEQGRSFIRDSVKFMEKFIEDQGYDSIEDIIGLAQPYIMNNEDVEMHQGKTRLVIDQDKCVHCARCVDNICQSIHFEKGQVVVDERCAGCGGCIIACPQGALSLELVENN